MTGVRIVGLAGAEPSRLGEALVAAGVDVGDTEPDAVIVAIDLSCDVGDEERELLAAQSAPTAIVACGVERHPDWPETTARARDALDPDRALALFAVSAADGRGVDDLADWCRAPDTAAPAPARRTPTPVVALADPVRVAAGPQRSDRMSGLRAGIAAARTETATAVRESVQSLAVTADRACADVRDGRAFGAWLIESIGVIASTAEAGLDERLNHVRRTATLGLPGVDPGDIAPEPPMRPASPPPHRNGSGEDAVVLLLGAAGGFGAGRMLVAPLVDGWLLGGVVTAVVGVAVAAWIVGVRRTAAARASLRRWTADTVSLARTSMEHRLIARVTAVEAHVSREIWNRTGPRRV
ncbi:hypothetical protein nbrc107696_20290 [Gordonia spumicola]|uniref:Uncharacterized protein n=1 Tax=Gordonia spumicola TaxID=589161 RepID=A0A7I9V913_9ACTN|nr:hypothetical protein [Gordonia spumicola]GEE01583.1 hypothetical protein nbrc107696_20290 [Gordonia spumicola]